MKIKLDRIISIATLTASVAALALVLKKPTPVAEPLPPPTVAANAQSFQSKIDQLEQARAQGQSGAEVRLNAQEISAAMAQASGALSAEPGFGTAAPAGSGAGSPLSGDLGAGEPSVKDYQVNFEGDVAKGQFLTHIAGKDVWVTMEGHLGSKDGYATFEPTFRITLAALKSRTAKSLCRTNSFEPRAIQSSLSLINFPTKQVSVCGPPLEARNYFAFFAAGSALACATADHVGGTSSRRRRAPPC